MQVLKILFSNGMHILEISKIRYGTYKAHGAVVSIFVALFYTGLHIHAGFVLLLLRWWGLFLVGFAGFFSSTTFDFLFNKDRIQYTKQRRIEGYYCPL